MGARHSGRPPAYAGAGLAQRLGHRLGPPTRTPPRLFHSDASGTGRTKNGGNRPRPKPCVRTDRRRRRVAACADAPLSANAGLLGGRSHRTCERGWPQTRRERCERPYLHPSRRRGVRADRGIRRRARRLAVAALSRPATRSGAVKKRPNICGRPFSSPPMPVPTDQIRATRSLLAEVRALMVDVEEGAGEARALRKLALATRMQDFLGFLDIGP